MRPKALNDSKSALAQRMHASCESAGTIATTLGVSRATVYLVLADNVSQPTGTGGSASTELLPDKLSVLQHCMITKWRDALTRRNRAFASQHRRCVMWRNCDETVRRRCRVCTVSSMTDLGQKYELWGTFSVWDHLTRGAFLAEVLMYDRLVIPVPPDPEKAETPEARAFAIEQRARWEHREPERLRALMKVLRPVAEPIEWDLEHHEQWLDNYADYDSGPKEASKVVGRILAGYVTGKVLLTNLPAAAQGAVAVAPFTDLQDLKEKLGITENDGLVQRQAASSGLRENIVSAVIGHEFLVPSDPDRDEFYLLQQAVDLVQEKDDYRLARRAFHRSTLQLINNGRTDFDSLRSAVKAMETELATLDRLARRQRIRNAVRRAFFFTQLATDIAEIPTNPTKPARVAIKIADYTTSEWLGNPARPDIESSPAGALLYDAQRKLDLTLQGERRTRRWRWPRRTDHRRSPSQPR